MHNFKRAFKIALQHRLNVATCVFTAVAVAILWGGNLTAVYPVVEVIMNNHALPDWIDQKIDESQRELNDSQRWVAELEKVQGSAPTEIQKNILLEVKQREEELAEHKKKSAPTWDSVQIAEKTRLENEIVHLESLAALAPDQLPAKVHQEISEAKNHESDYETRIKRFGWISPAAHRWLPTTPFRTLLVVCLFVLSNTLLKGIFRIWNSIAVARLGSSLGYDLRTDFYRKVLRLDVANFTESGRGDLMNRCTTDLNSITIGVQRIFGQALLEPLKAIVCLSIAAAVSWRLLLLTIIIAPPAGYSIHWLGKALKRTHRKAMQELSSIYETLSETLGGIKLIKAFTMEPAESSKFQRSAQQYYQRQMRIATYDALVSPVIETLGIAIVLIAAMMGGYLVLGQHTHILGIKISNTFPLTHGEMSVFFAMLAGLSDPARRISGEFSNIQQAIAAADRVYDVLDQQPSIMDPVSPRALPALEKSLRFENVSFQYHTDKPILRGVNLEVAAGETIAIVGPNGCGKTTLMQLLPRFYDPSGGRVTIDGVDIRDVRLQDLRIRCGLVSQEILMLNDTVENNICYGNPDATAEQVEDAARKAYAHAFITEKLPAGYKTIVGPSGSRLSGGQRQRISLARAILRDPEILLLDEATSQIDIESEQLIFEVLKSFSRGRTTFMITHRVSMISLADRVVVMDHGKIADIGSHNELVSRCDLYRRLCHFEYRESA
ncbi:MAG TPA: ABC transporter ATP-binding protein [Lacipirellulaceae bacterium]|nr:ABC transporter ATP-binding protein [Lacipirellulaceae bacterium]